MDFWMAGLPLKPFLDAVSALTPRPRVLLITAVDNPALMREQATLVDGFLPKPITYENLLAALQRIFAGGACAQR